MSSSTRPNLGDVPQAGGFGFGDVVLLLLRVVLLGCGAALLLTLGRIVLRSVG